MDTNFLNKIKAEMQGKSIQPAENAWKKMTLMLDAEEKKRKKRKSYWAYAAVFTGLLLGLSLVFQNDKKGSDIEITNGIVKETNQTNKIKDTLVQNNKAAIDQKMLESKNEALATTHKKVQRKHTTTSRKIKKQQNNIVDITQNIALATRVTQPENKLPVIEEQPKEAKKQLMHSSDDAIDAMLASAVKKNNKEQTFSLEVAENTLQKNAATAGEMTVNKFLKNILKTGVDTVEGIITSNDN